MDPITAFGIASGALQVADFSIKAIKAIREVYKAGSIAKLKEDEDIAARISNACERLSSKIQQSPPAESSDAKEVREIAQLCSTTAGELLEELAKLKTEGRGKLRAAAIVGFRAVRKSRLEDIQARMEGYQSALNTTLLLRLEQRANEETHKNEIDTIMRSLWFAEMHSRREQIPNTYRDTYKWVFSSPKQDTDRAGDREDEDADDEITVQSLGKDDLNLMKNFLSKHQTFNAPWDNFSTWLTSDVDLYWIKGKPGSGKSCLMNYIIQSPETQILLQQDIKQEVHIICYFFWTAGTERQKSVNGMLRSLLYQLFQVDASSAFEAVRNALGTGIAGENSFWSTKQLLEIVALVLDGHPNHIFAVFLDGLDECMESNQSELADVISELRAVANVKVCISSRPLQRFMLNYEKEQRLSLQDLNHNDIVKLVCGRLLPVLKRTSTLKHRADQKDLVESIIDRASGVFVWVNIVVNSVISGAQNEDSTLMLKERVETLPDDLYDLYSHLLIKLDKHSQGEAYQYLRLILTASRIKIHNATSSVLEIVFADDTAQPWKALVDGNYHYFLSPDFSSYCKRMEKRILGCCAGFIDIAAEIPEPGGTPVGSKTELSEELIDNSILQYTRHVSFIHKSVAEFLTSCPMSALCGEEPSERQIVDLCRGCLGEEFASRLQASILKHSLAHASVSMERFLNEFFHIIQLLQSRTLATCDHQHVSSSEYSEVIRLFDPLFNYIAWTTLRVRPWIQAHFRAQSKKPILLFSRPYHGGTDVEFINVTSLSAYYGIHGLMLESTNLEDLSPANLNYLLTCCVDGIVSNKVFATNGTEIIFFGGNVSLTKDDLDLNPGDADLREMKLPSMIRNVLNLLEKGANPNAKDIAVATLSALEWRLLKRLANNPYNHFFKFKLSIWMEYLYQLLTGRLGEVDRADLALPKSASSTRPWEVLVEAFLSKGADVNDRLFIPYNTVGLHLLFQFSTLSFMMYYCPEEAAPRQLVSKWIDMLRSKGATTQTPTIYAFFRNVRYSKTLGGLHSRLFRVPQALLPQIMRELFRCEFPDIEEIHFGDAVSTARFDFTMPRLADVLAETLCAEDEIEDGDPTLFNEHGLETDATYNARIRSRHITQADVDARLAEEESNPHRS